MNEIQQVRTLEQVAMEIRGYTSAMLTNIIEIGRRMVEAKEMLPYGEFGNWIRDNTGYSSSTANNFMRLYQEYGAAQGSLFGAEVDCQTFGKLSYSKALALLALPSGERESFVQENDVDAMSTRELQQAIADKKAAEERARQAEAEKEEILRSAQDDKAKIQEAEAKAKKWEEAAGSYASQANDLQNDLRDAQKQIHELETRPQPVAIERDEKAIEEAVQQAKAAASAEWSDKVQKLQADLEKANAQKDKLKAKADKASAGADEKIAAAGKETERIRQELEAARRQLKLADADVTAFGIHFTSLQQELNQALAALKKLAEKDLQTAGKLNGAVRQVLNKAGEEVLHMEELAAKASAEV